MILLIDLQSESESSLITFQNMFFLVLADLQLYNAKESVFLANLQLYDFLKMSLQISFLRILDF